MGKKWRRLNNADTVMPGDIFVWANGYRDTPSEYWYGHNVNQVMLIYSGISGIERRIKTRRSKWHRVEDKYPPDGRDCLLVDETAPQLVILGRRLEDEWFDGFSLKKLGKIWNITHWRELPKFKEERDA